MPSQENKRGLSERPLELVNAGISIRKRLHKLYFACAESSLYIVHWCGSGLILLTLLHLTLSFTSFKKIFILISLLLTALPSPPDNRNREYVAAGSCPALLQGPRDRGWLQ